jgi:hypothetical protein
MQVVASDGKVYDRYDLTEYLEEEVAVPVDEDEQAGGGGGSSQAQGMVRAPDGLGWIRKDSTMEFSEVTAKRLKAWLREVAWAAYLETDEEAATEVR